MSMPTPEMHSSGILSYNTYKIKEDKKNTVTRRTPPNIYQHIFLGYFYSCNNFGHKEIHCKAYRKYNAKNVQRYKKNKNNAEKRNYNSFYPLQDYNVTSAKIMVINPVNVDFQCNP
jgi:hypothetical protein